MSPSSYLRRIAELGFSQESAGDFFGASARTGQRWAAEGPPLPVAIVLLLVEDRDELNKLKQRANR